MYGIIYKPRNGDYFSSLISGAIALGADRDFYSPQKDECGNEEELGIEEIKDDCGNIIKVRRKTWSNIVVRGALVQYTTIFIARNISFYTNTFNRPENELLQECDIWTTLIRGVWSAATIYSEEGSVFKTRKQNQRLLIDTVAGPFSNILGRLLASDTKIVFN